MEILHRKFEIMMYEIHTMHAESGLWHPQGTVDDWQMRKYAQSMNAKLKRLSPINGRRRYAVYLPGIDIPTLYVEKES